MSAIPPWDLVCYSHLRWNSVFQRPHHLLTRCARERRVFLIEEPVHESGIMPYLDVAPQYSEGLYPSARCSPSVRNDGLQVVTPRIPPDLGMAKEETLLAELLTRFFNEEEIVRHVAWYYTPMALGFTRHLRPAAIVYDCMDELSAFLGAPPMLLDREQSLLRRAGVVFTGGQSLYEAKRDRHRSVHAFPSSIDASHFAKARLGKPDPADQAALPRPRIGFAGVIDERMDIDLLRDVAHSRPEWQFVMLGPVVKIDPTSLPDFENIHYLGQKPYAELPAYLSGWDVAWLPFARNGATKYISPTKTPEYLAAGRPVVSTSIRDVVRPYGEMGLVRIADSPSGTVAAMESAMLNISQEAERRARADAFIATMSWDKTWRAMLRHVEELLDQPQRQQRTQRRERERSRAASVAYGPSADAVG